MNDVTIIEECMNEVSDIMKDIDIEEGMNKVEREYGSSGSREEHKIRYLKRFKSFVKDSLKQEVKLKKWVTVTWLNVCDGFIIHWDEIDKAVTQIYQINMMHCGEKLLDYGAVHYGDVLVRRY